MWDTFKDIIKIIEYSIAKYLWKIFADIHTTLRQNK